MCDRVIPGQERLKGFIFLSPERESQHLSAEESATTQNTPLSTQSTSGDDPAPLASPAPAVQSPAHTQTRAQSPSPALIDMSPAPLQMSPATSLSGRAGTSDMELTLATDMDLPTIDGIFHIFCYKY